MQWRKVSVFSWIVWRLMYVITGITFGLILGAVAMAEPFTKLQDFRTDAIDLIEACTEEFGEGCSLVALPNSILMEETAL